MQVAKSVFMYLWVAVPTINFINGSLPVGDDVLVGLSPDLDPVGVATLAGLGSSKHELKRSLEDPMIFRPSLRRGRVANGFVGGEGR